MLHRKAAALVLAAAVLTSGCSGARPLNLPIPERQRRALGEIGLVVAADSAADDLRRPVTGFFSGFGRGASMGFHTIGGTSGAAGVVADIASFTPAGVLAYAGLLAVNAVASIGGGMVGSVAGIFKRVPKRRVEEARKELRRAADELSAAETLKAAFLSESRKFRGLRLVDAEKFPAAGAVLSVTIVQAGLDGKRRFNADLYPSVVLKVTLEQRLVRSRSKKDRKSGGPVLLYQKTLGYADPKSSRKYIDWGARNAREFRRAMRDVYPRVARGVLFDVLIGQPKD